MSAPTPSAAWVQLALELSKTPGLVKALLNKHRPDRAGYCVACTANGQRVKPHPCEIAKLAQYADAARLPDRELLAAVLERWAR